MKKVFTFLLVALFVTSVFGQRPTGLIKKASEPPIIGDFIDDVWDEAEVYEITRNFQSETPTVAVGGPSTWRALWDDDGIYVLVMINDDDWFPYYEASVDHWMADKVEIYFDVNYDLADGGGTAPNGIGGGNGHYQVAPEPREDALDGTPITLDGTHEGVVFAYNVIDPDYWVEYFVPWAWLVDGDGIPFNKTADMGFDVTIIDRDTDDTDRNRAVWANDGAIDESWNNMNDVGYVKLDGAEPGIDIDEINISDGEITKNQETLQMVAEILPEDATNKNVIWSIQNTEGQTGRATISSTGLISPLTDGEITVVAESPDKFVRAEAVVTISGQTPSRWRFNVIRNGLFNDGLNRWGGGSDIGTDPEIVDGAVLLSTSELGADPWSYGFSQAGFRVQQGVPYHFSFTAWGDERSVRVNFEDPSQDYLRFGESDDPGNVDGRSEWDFDVTSEPTRYVYSVIFNDMTENTAPAHNFHLGLDVGEVYLDSILLITEADLALSVPDDQDIAWNVGVVTEDFSNLRVFPNPFTNEVFVRNTENIKRVSVTNLVGQRVIDMEVRGDINIDTQQLKGGVYLMIFEGNNGQRVVHKMIKQ